MLTVFEDEAGLHLYNANGERRVRFEVVEDKPRLRLSDARGQELWSAP